MYIYIHIYTYTQIVDRQKDYSGSIHLNNYYYDYYDLDIMITNMWVY